MLRLLLRQILLTVVSLVATSIVVFVALDQLGAHDWWGTLGPGARAGVARDEALARNLPTLWNRRVADARVRTLDDLANLADPARREAAAQRLARRGTAGLPTILRQLRALPPAARDAALGVLAAMGPTLTGGERPPESTDAALAYWDRFDALRSLDFRAVYARRQVQRVLERDSRNAAEQLTRLGTYALPSVFEVLDGAVDGDAARRLTALLSDITHRELRIAPAASALEAHATVEAWRAWWFTERLEYEQLTDVGRALGHVTETRYGRWLVRALSGRLGTSRVTGEPIARELRERLPTSVLIGGLGGLLATALVVAFAGGPVLRRRPWRIKLADLVGALVPGLAAFAVGFVVLCQLCAAPRPAAPLVRMVLAPWPRLLLAVALVSALAAAWLRRRSARVLLHAVRKEAESWVLESRDPKLGQIVRHGARVGLASLLAPLGLSAGAALAMSLLVEPLVGVRGMGAISLASLRRFDAPWLLVAILSAVPLLLSGRWARAVLVWALGASATGAGDDDEEDGGGDDDAAAAGDDAPPPDGAGTSDATPAAPGARDAENPPAARVATGGVGNG